MLTPMMGAAQASTGFSFPNYRVLLYKIPRMLKSTHNLSPSLFPHVYMYVCGVLRDRRYSHCTVWLNAFLAITHDPLLLMTRVELAHMILRNYDNYVSSLRHIPEQSVLRRTRPVCRMVYPTNLSGGKHGAGKHAHEKPVFMA